VTVGRLLVIIESPYAGEVDRNIRYAQAALRDSLGRGEAPLASHLLYTQVLDDSVAEERAVGIDAASEFYDVVDRVAVYEDLGISPGMKLGIERASEAGKPVTFRRIPGWEG
jgi:hypothetical protein